MKTPSQIKKSELKSRPEHSSTPNTESGNQNQTPTKAERPTLPLLDYDKRREYRGLPTDRVLALLRTEAPRLFKLAQIVGKWVWIQFTDKQPREVTSVLSQLGFHWNNKRQAWQHPCGHLTRSTPNDPRAKYGVRAAHTEVPA